MTTEPEIVTLEPATTAVVAATVPMAELTTVFDTGFSQIGAALARQGVEPVSAAFGLYHGEVGETVDLEIGFVTDRPVATEGDVHASTLPGGRVARVVHAGGFDGLAESWAGLRAWIVDQGLTPGDDIWEVYDTEPNPEMDPADLRTSLHWPVREV